MSAIRSEDLTKRYGETVALDQLNLVVEAGEVYGYLGPNGAGKTTTIRLLLGLHRPTAGRASCSASMRGRDPVTAHRRVAYVAGEPFLWPSLTGARDARVPRPRCTSGTDVAPTGSGWSSASSSTRDKKIRALSKGNRQKVQLIAALATRADLLLLDEPTSGLDPLMEVAFRECVAGGQAARADHVPLLAHPQRGRGPVRSGRDPAGRAAGRRRARWRELRHLAAQTVEVTFAATRAGTPAAARSADRIAAGPNALRFEVSGRSAR